MMATDNLLQVIVLPITVAGLYYKIYRISEEEECPDEEES
jgi:hypothetical protein